MAPGRGTAWIVKRKGWALLLVALLVALTAGAVAIPRFLARTPRTRSEGLDDLYLAWNEFNARRYDRAAAILDRRAGTARPTGLDWMLRARIAEAQGRLSDALDDLKKISDSDPISAQAWLKAGQIEIARHHAGPAEAALRRSIAINPDQLQTHRELAYLYATQRRKADCDAQFRALSQRMTMGYVLAFVWCQNFCDIWDPNESGTVLEKFVAEDPSDRWSRLALAASYFLKHQLDTALATLAPLADSDVDAQVLRVKIAIEKGDIETASALARGGPADEARLNVLRGQLALNTGDPRRATDLFRAAVEKDPESRHAIHGLGMSLKRLNDPDADRWLQLAARHDALRRTIVDSVTTLQTDPRLFTRLGTLCEALHRDEEARVWYHIAIERDPLDTEAQQGLTRVAPGEVPRRPSTTSTREYY